MVSLYVYVMRDQVRKIEKDSVCVCGVCVCACVCVCMGVCVCVKECE
jgi:hypothetical protein